MTESFTRHHVEIDAYSHLTDTSLSNALVPSVTVTGVKAIHVNTLTVFFFFFFFFLL